jgi:nuclear cap-binding protein subunit 1
MSEDYSRKRQRSEELEGDAYYDPRAQAQQEQDELPPHLQVQGQAVADDTLPPHEVAAAGAGSTTGDATGLSSQQYGQHGEQNYGQGYGGGYGGGGYGGRKRQRYSAMSGGIRSAVDLCASLQNLGDFTHEVKMMLSQNSETISYLWKDYEFSSNILKFLGAVFYEMPHKSVLFSGLVMLANAKNENVGRDIVSWLKARIVEVFEAMETDGDDGYDVDGEMGHGKTWNRVILLLRALALFANILEDPEEILNVFETLLDRAIQMQSDSEDRNGLAELIYYETVLSVPYLLVNDLENEELKTQLKQLIAAKGEKFPIRDTSAKDFMFKPYSVNTDDETCVPMKYIVGKIADVTLAYLDDMSLFYNVRELVDPSITTILTERAIKAEKIKAEQKAAEAEDQTADHDVADEDAEKPPIQPEEVPKHTLGEVHIPSVDIIQKYANFEKFVSTCDKLWKTPRYLVHVFPFEETRKGLDFETVPPVDSFISILINDLMNNVLFNLEFNRVTASKQLTNLQLYFNEKMFAKPNSPLDKLMIINDLNSGIDFDLVKNLEDSTDFEEGIKSQMIASAKKIQYEHGKGFTGTWKMEEIFLENLMGHIFQLPESDVPLIFFETLIADTCGRNWTFTRREGSHEVLLFSKLVGDCFRYFYENIEKFEFESLVRFVNWFLTQISHFKFEWRWEDWVGDVLRLGEEKVYNPKLFFIKNVIHKELLVTNYKFIRNVTLPAEFKKFANISLKSKNELEKYDEKFFGARFAKENTTNPFEGMDDETGGAMEKSKAEELMKHYGEVDLNEAVETNTDAFNLFSHYLFNHEDHPYNDICRDVYMNLENVEESVESLIELTTQLRTKIENDDGSADESSHVVQNSDEYIVALVVQSICLIGSRSFSVFEESLQKVFGDKLKSVLESIDNDQKVNWIIDAVMRIWNNEPRIGFMFIDRLSKHGVLEENTIIQAVWNACDDKILPLGEIYADEFLTRLLDDYDNEGDIIIGDEGTTTGEERAVDVEDSRAKQREAVKFYFEMAIGKLNDLCRTVSDAGESELTKTALNALTEESSDALWSVRELRGLLEGKLRKYGALFAAGELAEMLGGGVEHAELRDELVAAVEA